jgi:raffinose/stachyose/melibiose transport system substrate-binding protein
MKRGFGLTVIAVVVLALAATSVWASGTKEGSGPKTITYFTSKPPTDNVVVAMQKVAQQYKAEGHAVDLVVDTAADRPAYVQKLRTLVAGNQMPEIFDLDADPYAAQLGSAGKLVDMQQYLKKIGAYDSYIKNAIEYQRLPDGRIFSFPNQFVTEMTWYNVDIFNKYNLKAPKTFDEWLEVCRVLASNGVTPIAIDGLDGWPIMRYIAMVPFRLSGNDYITALSTGKAKMSDTVGMAGVNFVAQVGKYFQTGFSSTDYTTAKNLFLGGKTAMYEIGTWELTNFIAANLPAGLKVDYFYMPTAANAVTKSNEYWAFGGIGIAAAKDKFDAQTEAFVTYLIKHYDAVYLKLQQYPPTKFTISDPSAFDPLFIRVQKDQGQYGDLACKPWDVLLPADVNSTMADNLVALALGKVTPDDFAKVIDQSLAQNLKK